MNPQNYNSLNQHPHPDFVPKNRDFSSGQPSVPYAEIKFRQQAVYTNIQDPGSNDVSISTNSESSISIDFSSPLIGTQDKQVNLLGTNIPVKTDNVQLNQGIQPGSQDYRGIPMKDPSISQIQNQNNISAWQPPLLINQRVQASMLQNVVPIKEAQSNNTTFVQNSQVPPLIMNPIAQGKIPQNGIPSNPPQFILNKFQNNQNQPNTQLSRNPNFQYQFTPSNPQSVYANSISTQNQQQHIIPNVSQINEIKPIPQFLNPQNSQYQFTPEMPQSLHKNNIPAQNQKEIPANIPNLKPSAPSFISPNPYASNIPSFVQTQKQIVQNSQANSDMSSTFKPLPSFAFQHNFQNSPQPSQDFNMNGNGNSQSGIPNLPSAKLNSGPAFPQQVTIPHEESLGILTENLPQGSIPNTITEPPEVKINELPANFSQLNVSNSLVNPLPPDNLPKIDPNVSQNSLSKILNQPFETPQRIDSSISEKVPSPDDFQNLEEVPCEPTIANKLNSRRIIKEIEKIYSLPSIKYNGSNFMLKGDSAATQQAAEYLKAVIGQESNTVHWEWLHETGSFIPYKDTDSRLIDNAYLTYLKPKSDNSPEKDKKIMVNIPINGIKYNFIFGNSCAQLLPNSNISRTIRRKLANQDQESKNDSERAQGSTENISNDEVTWYWEEDGGIYKNYTPEASRQIEEAYKINSKALVQGSNIKGYLVDLEKLVQTNEITGWKRRIKRCVGRNNPNINSMPGSELQSQSNLSSSSYSQNALRHKQIPKKRAQSSQPSPNPIANLQRYNPPSPINPAIGNPKIYPTPLNALQEVKALSPQKK